MSKALFIIPTDAHNYKIIETLKTIKIPTIAPTCFDSHRNHHQGAISCLAKTIIMILLCYCAVPHACTTGWYAAITLTTSVTTIKIES